MKILFMGTPDFAEESLKAIVENNYNIVGVVTNPDRPKGRGMKLVCSPVKEYAISKAIPVYQPDKIKGNTAFINKIKEINPDIICVVAYGKILPREILEIPKYGCINVHASLLPKYRGAAPIQWSILNGDKITGVTTMYMDIGMDTGDILLKRETAIGEDETTGELWNRLSKIGGELLVETLKCIENGTVTRQKQSDDYTMAPMLDKSMARIDWENKTACQIKNLVRGLNPIMGAYSYLNDRKIKIWKIDVITNEELVSLFPELMQYAHKINEIMPGTVVFSEDKEGLYIKANNGIIKVLELQAENSRRMNTCDFLRGNKINVGNIFS